jgi:hypothetical protein
VGYKEERIELLETHTGQILNSWPCFDFFQPVAISPDGEQFVWAYGNNHNESGIYIAALNSDWPRRLNCSQNVRRISFSQNGERVAAVSWNWSGAVWDSATRVCLRNFNSQLAYPNSSWQLNSSFINFDFITIADSPEERPLVDCLTKYHISPDGAWIMMHTKKLLWLPPEYRPSDAVASRSNIAIGRKSGLPFVIRLSYDGH